MEAAFRIHGIDTIVHFAAESHVDRSILGAACLCRRTSLGTQVLLDVARDAAVERFLHVSTDEVYGSLGAEGKFTEYTPLHPNSPYAASKAARICSSWRTHHTFGLPVIVTRCSNNYGPYQFPEKLIPLMIINALNDKPLPVYGDGLNVRDWLYVEDHCAAIDVVLERGRSGRCTISAETTSGRTLTLCRLHPEEAGQAGEPDQVRERPAGSRPAVCD